MKRNIKLNKIVGNKVVLSTSNMLPEKEKANLKLEVGKYYFLGNDPILITGETKKQFECQICGYNFKNKKYQEEQQDKYEKEWWKIHDDYKRDNKGKLYEKNEFSIIRDAKLKEHDDIYYKNMTIDDIDIIETNVINYYAKRLLKINKDGNWCERLKSSDIVKSYGRKMFK